MSSLSTSESLLTVLLPPTDGAGAARGDVRAAAGGGRRTADCEFDARSGGAWLEV